MSVDTADCTDNLEGLGKYELDALGEWEAKFQYKYPITGTLIKGNASTIVDGKVPDAEESVSEVKAD
jgi:hypothetical protein